MLSDRLLIIDIDHSRREILMQILLILGGGGASTGPRKASADGGEAWRGDTGVLAFLSVSHYCNGDQNIYAEVNFRKLRSM